MKELSNKIDGVGEAMPNPNVPKPRRYRETPRWRVAKSRTDQKYQQMQNDCVEAAYHRIISVVKELIIAHGGDTIFECNHKNDPDSYTGMHSLVTSSFYWRLDCELAYNYEVYFAFHNCAYEAAIRELMKPYPLDRTTHLYHFPQGYDTFYKRVLEVQSPIHITTLKVTG